MVFRIAVSLLAVGYVIWKVSGKWDDCREMLQRPWTSTQWTLLIASILLMPLNYALESQKWRLMVRPFYPTLGLWQATVAVMAGMAAGVFTPNRIGDYAGRILFLRQGRRVEAVIATFVDRICQLFISLVVGLIGLLALYLLPDATRFQAILGDPITQGIFIFLSLVLGAIAMLLVLAPRRISTLIPERWNRASWVRKTRYALQNLDMRLVVRVLALALLRYTVFSTQYVLLMYALGYEGAAGAAFLMVVLVFLGKSVLPVMGIFELGVRESVALLIMTAFGVAEATAVGSTLLLYLLNILLPTLLGVVALQRPRVYA